MSTGNRQAALFLSSPIVLGGEWPKLPFTARIGRAHSYRARSASTGIVPVTPPSFSASAKIGSLR